MGMIDTGVPDIYADNIAEVEILGGSNARISYFTWQRGEKVIVAKLVMPLVALNRGTISKLLGEQLRRLAEMENTESRMQH